MSSTGRKSHPRNPSFSSEISDFCFYKFLWYNISCGVKGVIAGAATRT
ncbi:MAG: hypothetical protein BWY51_00818 [Parcubacteria group bacterium ADurb.Bin316]|nr:MAG: hypothetical protein BWY51_00818 [Parcubacteria group bacterium ADurb.Bin316]